MYTHSKLLGIILSVTALAATLGAEPSPDASPSAAESATSIDVTVPLDNPTTLTDALAVADESVGEPVSVRVEAPGMVGEYFVDSRRTPREYTEWFEDQWGTQPEVVAVVLEVPAEPAPDQAPASDAGQPVLEPAIEVPSVIDTGKAAFESDQPDGGEVYEQFEELLPAESASDPNVTATLAALKAQPVANTQGGNWKPREVEVRIERSADRTYISQYANWKGATTPAAMPQRVHYVGGGNARTVDWGMEFDVSFYSNTLRADKLRPAGCPVGNYEDEFIAKNNQFNWGVSVGSTGLARTGSPGDIQAYADTFDWGDSCNRQSLAVGIKRPWLIPKNSRGFYSILVSIDAENGKSNRDKIGGTVQLVDDYACQVAPFTSYTDCMGDHLIQPEGIDAGRLYLSTDNNWVAFPEKCWISTGYGYDQPIRAQFNTPSGCYQ